MYSRLTAAICVLCVLISTGYSQDLFEVVGSIPSSGVDPDVSPEGTQMLIGLNDGLVALIGLTEEVPLETFPGRSATFSASGNSFVVVNDVNFADIYDRKSLAKVRRFDFDPTELIDARLSATGARLFVILASEVGNDTETWAHAFDVETGVELWSRIVGINGGKRRLIISGDNVKLATGLTNLNAVIVMNPDTGDLIYQPIQESDYNDVQFTADSSRIIVGTQTGYNIYDALSGVFERTVPHINAKYAATTLGLPVAALHTSSYQAEIYHFRNSTTWTYIGDYRGFSVQGSRPAFSPDGKYFVYAHGPSWGGGRVYVVINPTATLVKGPISLQMVRGVVFSGNLESLIDSDNNMLTVRPGVVLSSAQYPIQVEVESVMAPGKHDSLRLICQSQGSAITIRQTIELYNFVSQQYVVCDSRLNFGSSHITTEAVGMASEYVQPGTGVVRARLSYRATAPVLSFPWNVKLNYISWRAGGI